MARRVRVLLVGDAARLSGSREEFEAAGLDVEAVVSMSSAFEGRAPEVIVVSDDRSLQRVVSEVQERAARAPAVVVLTSEEAIGAEIGALGLPGWAIVPPDASGAEIAAAVLAAAHGFAVTPTRGGEPGEERPEIVEALTPRERDVLNLIAEGLPNKTVAARLGISEHTVKFHLASIFGKLGVSTRTEAVRAGLRAGLITL